MVEAGLRTAIFATLAVLSVAGCRAEDILPQKKPPTHAELIALAKKRGERDCAKDHTYMMSANLLRDASEQMELGEYRRANMLLRDVEDGLGDVWLGSDVLDDSGLFLAGAWSEEWNGDQERAAVRRHDILSNRLKSYVELENLSSCPSPADGPSLDQLHRDLK